MSSGLGRSGGVDVRQPRCWLVIGEARLPCIEASVTRTATKGSDSFSAELSITATEQYGFGLAEWTDFEEMDAKIIFSCEIGGGDARVMMTGKVDEPDVNIFDMTVSVTGRDKSSSLIEKRRNEKFNNKKTKDIVEKIAKDHGLKAEVELKGDSGYAGKIYDQDTAHLVLNRTDFELLSDLAEREGCRWFVDGDTIVFEPDGKFTGKHSIYYYPPGTVAAYAVSNVKKLSLKRNMSAAREHRVRIKSYHHRQRKLFTAETKVPGISPPVEYEDHHSGRTQEQVKQLAESRAKDAVRHELSIDFEAPGDLAVDVRQEVSLTGTGTIYDQSYEIERLTWSMGWDEGFDMTGSAKSAKSGRNPETTTKSRGGKSVNQDGPATKTVPLPPQRPSSLGGGGTST